MSMTTVKVSFLITFLNASCVRESTKPYPADAPIVHINPITYFPLETPEESEEESVSKTRRIEDMVRRTRELSMKGVNFCELRKNEKKALKANCDAQMRE
jgi:hypothetical protein